MRQVGDEMMYSRKEAAKYLGCSPGKLWREANERRIRFTMLPAGMFFTKAALDQWLKGREVAVCRR